jgi:Ni2+-binding GTPase involved in maturation of urease and hydrogenase
VTRLHLVNGFLGSGKTTAIVTAARQHIARGERVGVVTNDQGRYLVDTAFMRAAQVPTVQVTGGCFCCAYDQLLDVLGTLGAEGRPDVLYAESVGSCADLLATVVRPLLAQPGLTAVPRSLSVFADSRLLLRLWQGQELPLSDDVLYIIDRQVQEAGVLVLNKSDLLNARDRERLDALARERLPRRPVLAQDSRASGDVARWVALVESGAALSPAMDVPIDYCRYAAGELQLTWADQLLEGRGDDGRALVIGLVEAVLAVLEAHGVPVGHLKAHVRAGDASTGINWPTLGNPGWRDGIPPLASPVEVLLNARVQAHGEDVEAWLAQARAAAEAGTGGTWQLVSSRVFTPAPPTRPARAGAARP